MLPQAALFISSCLSAVAAAAQQQQSQTIVYPTTASASATAPASTLGYTYAGCWNETTEIANTGGQRALTDGNSSTSNALTIASCLTTCGAAGAAFAGLEYGRECYCGRYLSAFSARLPDDRCVFACDGDAGQICGGALALSLYNRTASGTGWVAGRGAVVAAWYAVVGGVVLGVAAGL